MFDGRFEDLKNSLRRLLDMKVDSVVQGHGEVILRGEVAELIHSDLAYLDCIKNAVETVIDRGEPEATLENISIESCGKSRIPLNGFVVDLHLANLRSLYHQLSDKTNGGPAD